MRVIFTPAAERHIDNIYRYIAGKSSDSIASGYVARIVAFCRGLAHSPLRGTKRDDLLRGLRTVGFERRVTIAFTTTADAVMIEGIYYGGRDFERRYRS